MVNRARRGPHGPLAQRIRRVHDRGVKQRDEASRLRFDKSTIARCHHRRPCPLDSRHQICPFAARAR